MHRTALILAAILAVIAAGPPDADAGPAATVASHAEIRGTFIVKAQTTRRIPRRFLPTGHVVMSFVATRSERRLRHGVHLTAPERFGYRASIENRRSHAVRVVVFTSAPGAHDGPDVHVG